MLATLRLLLHEPDPTLAGAVANFLQRNAAHLRPWEPPRPPDMATAAHQRELLANQALAPVATPTAGF
jgi:[ribosomal protein S5]-alanine N-acetyltransferase